MIFKKCFKCNIDQPLSEYYKHVGMADGHLNKCKKCTKKESWEREKGLRSNLSFVESEKDRHRNKYHRLSYKNKHKPSPEDRIKTMQNYRKKFPEKYRAHILSQRLYRPEGYELHHWNYNEVYAKDIIEVSIEDHSHIHRFLQYDSSLYIYRTKEGVLLDTKEKHVDYITEIIKIK